MSSDARIRRILHKAWKTIALPRSQNEGKLPISSPTSVTRMRSLTVPLNENHDSNHSPLYANATELEKQEYLPRGRSSLSKTILTLTFQAAFVIQNQSNLFGAAMVIAFAASFSVLYIKDSYPQIAAAVEKIGSLSLALGFFAMTGFFLTGSLIWKIITGMAFAWTLLAFLIGCPT